MLKIKLVLAQILQCRNIQLRQDRNVGISGIGFSGILGSVYESLSTYAIK